MIYYYIIINIIAFLIYGIDKRKAIKKKWRISEKTLLGISFLGGSMGSILAMFIFKHKTKHYQFLILVPLSSLIHIYLIYHFYYGIMLL